MQTNVTHACITFLILFCRGDGSCLFYAASRLTFGEPNRATEMRVRTIFEGVANSAYYLDCEAMSAGLKENDGKITQMYASLSGIAAACKEEDDIQNVYEEELVHLSSVGAYGSIWQIHQLASVMGRPIYSIYPEFPGVVSPGIKKQRDTYNRVLFPRQVDLQGQITAHIMWTPSIHTEGRQNVNHFVPVVM